MARGADEQGSALEVRVDRTACRGAGECAYRAPATFRIDEDAGKAAVSDPAGDPRESVLAAARACPNFAIEVWVEGERVV